MPTVRNKAGLEKVFVDNLEELGNLSARTDIADSSTSVFLKADPSGVLEVSDSNITKGESIVAGGGDGLQQVLLYGKNGVTGNLEPLETSSDRLLVDVVELAASGPITTSTALASMQICGYNTDQSRFKTLKCDSDGKLIISESSTRSASIDHVSSSTVGANLQIGSTIDIGDKKSIIIVGNASGNHSISVLHSTDNANFYLYSTVSPVSHDSLYHYNVNIENGLRFYQLFNSNQSNTFDLDYVTY
jgi:hypothetical protein